MQLSNVLGVVNTILLGVLLVYMLSKDGGSSSFAGGPLFRASAAGKAQQQGRHTDAAGAAAAAAAAGQQQPDASNCTQQPRAPVCSYADADSHFVCNSTFPVKGGWAGSSNTWQYEERCAGGRSGACLFAEGQPQSQYVLVLGDSQGMHYTEGVVQALGQAPGVTCTRSATEAEGRTDVLFGVPEGKYSRADCQGCSSSRTVCTLGSRSLTVEYIRMEFTMDFELSTPVRIHWDNNCFFNSTEPPCKWAFTTQQFIFEVYLPRQARPLDQLHIFQNCHDCARRTARDFRRDLAWLLDLIDASLPPASDVYYWEATATNPIHQGQWANFTDKRCIDSMNAAVKEALLPRVQRTLQPQFAARTTPGWHATFGLNQPSSERLQLNGDGVHYNPEWYAMVGQTLLSGLCEVQRNAAASPAPAVGQGG